MRIGILGSGNVARAFAAGFSAEGHQVMLGTRTPAQLQEWANGLDAAMQVGTPAQTAAFGELIVLAVAGVHAAAAIALAGPAHFAGKVVLDATNPLDKSGDRPVLLGAPGTSGGELIQQALPDARVVKAFNTVGYSHFYRPRFSGGPPDMFLCGNDPTARQVVAGLCQDFGWHPVDVGGMEVAHYLEATGMLWITLWRNTGEWDRAFKLLGR
ncbi:MAG: NAD(P)-binding domain-containing protein [Xanthomonadales bacterium]|nr:NAD(P)-binding domain-containing protein [Xanthomonadales bacterium]MCB1641027.1 NAD(P)-binding domain-containing protein [Xanthomonadales bacterium]